MATEADVEQVKVFGAFGGEAGADGQRGHVAQRAEVKGQSSVVLHVGEGAVAVATRVLLNGKGNRKCFSSQNQV